MIIGRQALSWPSGPVVKLTLFTIGDSFSLTVTQPGKNDAFVKEVVRAFENYGISCCLAGGKRYQMPDYQV